MFRKSALFFCSFLILSLLAAPGVSFAQAVKTAEKLASQA